VCLRALVTLSTALLITAAPPVHGDGSYEIREVAAGVYAALQPAAGRFNESNSAILVNDRDVVVVDSQSRPALVRELIAEIRKLTDKPVRYVVNTHFHFDHTHGNQVFGPEVEILAHDFTYGKLARGESQKGRGYEAFVLTIPERIRQAEERLATLEGAEREAFEADYRARVRPHYPPEADGRTLFPFRRLFIVARRAS